MLNISKKITFVVCLCLVVISHEEWKLTKFQVMEVLYGNVTIIKTSSERKLGCKTLSKRYENISLCRCHQIIKLNIEINICSLNILMFRTSIQCAAWCTDYDTCVAFRWQENTDNFLCTLISKEGLCLDMDRVNPTKVFVDQNNIPTRGKFRHFYSVKGFK